MSAPFVIPFNFAPTSVTVRTSSYTLPTGKYAQVYVECDSGGIFTIDGASAVVTAAFLNVDQAGAASTTYTTPVGYKASLSGIASATDGFTVNGNLGETINLGTYSQVFNVGPGGSFKKDAVNLTGSSFVQGVATPSNATNRQATFWVKSGTVISGTGNWKAVVQEYNTIT